MLNAEYRIEQPTSRSAYKASAQPQNPLDRRAAPEMPRSGPQSSHTRVGQWTGGNAVVIEREPHGPTTEFCHCLPEHAVSLHAEGVNTRTAISYDGSVPKLGGGTLGQVMFIPATHRVEGWSDFRTRIRHIVVLLDPAIIEAEISEAGNSTDDMEIPFYRDLGDGFIANRMRELQFELENPGLLGRFYIESLTCGIAARLVRRHANKAESIVRGGLRPRRLRLVKDYIESNLPNEITLADLSKIAAVSPTHFCRSFHKSTGISSHQYILRRRIERAKELLIASKMPIAEIALATGFSDQSHLTKQFRSLVGTTPWRFRNDA